MQPDARYSCAVSQPVESPGDCVRMKHSTACSVEGHVARLWQISVGPGSTPAAWRCWCPVCRH